MFPSPRPSPKGLEHLHKSDDSRSFGESQGDFVSKLMVGVQRLSWEKSDWEATTPLGLWISLITRVARSSQPWAGGYNPFGIEVPPTPLAEIY